jgi:hypothetical protein
MMQMREKVSHGGGKEKPGGSLRSGGYYLLVGKAKADSDLIEPKNIGIQDCDRRAEVADANAIEGMKSQWLACTSLEGAAIEMNAMAAEAEGDEGT